MTTLNDLIQRVYLRATGGRVETFCTLGNGVTTTTQNVVTLAGVQVASITTGTRLSMDLEIMLVTSYNTVDQQATVLRGFNGSTPATHTAGVPVFIDPEYSWFDIANAINDDLRDLSGYGLWRIGTVTPTFVPVYKGYDLGGAPASILDVLKVQVSEATPYRRFPTITEWELKTRLVDSLVPSGNVLVVYQEGYPGRPLQIVYCAPLIPLVALTDSVTTTPTANDPAPPYNGWNGVTSVPNLPVTATDIPVLGALIQLTQPREISRNDMGEQPEPRKAQEVPPQAIATSTNALMAARLARINTEARMLRRTLRTRTQ